MCWLILIKHAVENPNSTSIQPQENGNMSSIICWGALVAIYVYIVGWVKIKCDASALTKSWLRLGFVHILCLCQRRSGLLMRILDFFSPIAKCVELGFWNPMKKWLKLSFSGSDTNVFKDCSKHFGLNFPSALALKTHNYLPQQAGDA